MDFDPFGDDQEVEKPEEGYSVLRGSPKDPDPSEEAQGRRAQWHLRRIRQAARLSRTKRGVLAAEIEGLEEDLRRAKHELAQVDNWREAQCSVDRVLLAQWQREAPQLNDPDRPRQKTIVFSEGLGIASKSKTNPDKIVLADEGAVMQQFPDFVTAKPVLEWERLKKTLTVTGDGVVSEDGELVEGVMGMPRTTEIEFFALIDGERIPLQGGVTDGTGDADGADNGVGPEDPFGE